MKRLFLSACLVFGLLASTNAQESGDFQFGVQAGLNLSTLNGDGMDASIKPGFNVGGTVDYFFSENFYLESGLSFSLKGAKYKYDLGVDLGVFDFSLPETKVNMYYLELPILAAYRFNLTDNFKLDILAGPYVAFGVGGKVKTDMEMDFMGVDIESEETETDVFGDKGSFNRFDFGLKFGIKANIHNFYVTAGYELGLIDIAKEAEVETSSEDFGDLDGYDFGSLETSATPSIKTGNIFVGVGYVF